MMARFASEIPILYEQEIDKVKSHTKSLRPTPPVSVV